MLRLFRCRCNPPELDSRPPRNCQRSPQRRRHRSRCRRRRTRIGLALIYSRRADNHPPHHLRRHRHRLDLRCCQFHHRQCQRTHSDRVGMHLPNRPRHRCHRHRRCNPEFRPHRCQCRLLRNRMFLQQSLRDRSDIRRRHRLCRLHRCQLRMNQEWRWHCSRPLRPTRSHKNLECCCRCSRQVGR